jgi:hypothetical protein
LQWGVLSFEEGNNMRRALLMITMVLAVFTITVAHAQSSNAQTSSACLALPTDTVNQWTSLFPNGNTDQQCGNNCSTWVKTCNNMASASYRCFYALFQSTMTLDIADCVVLSDPARGDCIASAQSSFRSMVNSLQSDLANARSICGDDFSDCFSNCID